MRKISALLLVCLVATNAVAQNAVMDNTPVATPKQNLWTPENLWILICSVIIIGFIFIFMHAMSSAVIALAGKIEKKA